MKPKDIQYVKYIVHKYLRTKPELSEFADDLEQEGNIAWLDATEAWDPERTMMDKQLFVHYRIQQRLMNYINREERKHFRKPESDTESPFWQMEEPVQPEDLHEDTVDKDALREMLSGIEFTKRQLQVMELYFEGWTYREIAEKLSIKKSWVGEIMDSIVHNVQKNNDL